MRKISSGFFTLAIFAFFSTTQAFAQPGIQPAVCPAGQTQTDFGCLPSSPIGFVEKFYGIGLGLLGMICLIYMIIGGYFILMSRGNIERLQKGKMYIYYSLAGLFLAILGFVFIEVITGNILKIPGFS